MKIITHKFLNLLKAQHSKFFTKLIQEYGLQNADVY